jgi:UDP-galactose transporter B1
MPSLEHTSSDETTHVSNVKLDSSIHQPLVPPASGQHVIHRKGAGKSVVPFEIDQDGQEYRDDASDGTAPAIDDSTETSLQSLSADEETTSTKAEIGPEASTNSTPASVYIQTLKLLFGAGGIYMAFLYNGLLQEDVFRHKSSAGDGSSFKQAWLLSVIEAAANVVVGFLGRRSYTCTDPTANLASLPQKHFIISGAAQVLSKSFKSLALANGLSFPIATLAKSGKMAPVMLGSLVLGGASYSMREFLQVAAIIAGTAVVSMGKSGKSGEVTCTALGIAFISLSLSLDGVTGGVQKGLMRDMAQRGMKPRPYDLMYYTNAYMLLVAGLIAFGLGEFQSGYDYIKINPEIFPMILKFSLCSAVGQSFIFYTIAHFDPLVCTTVTTTRKIFSVVLSIVFKGHALSFQGWSGVLLASSGIASEVHEKYHRAKANASKTSAPPKSVSKEEPDEEMASLIEDSVITKKESKEA